MNFKDFKQSISGIPAEDIVFVGLGNMYIKDDTAGIIFLHYLEQVTFFQDSHFIYAGINPENHLQKIIDLKPSLIIFIDMVDSENCSSDIIWLNSDNIDTSEFSTHAYSIKLIEKYILMYISTTIRYLGITLQSCSNRGNNLSEKFGFIADFFKQVQTQNV